MVPSIVTAVLMAICTLVSWHDYGWRSFVCSMSALSFILQLALIAHAAANPWRRP